MEGAQKMETSIGRETKEWAKGRTWDHLMKLTDGEKANGPGSDGESAACIWKDCKEGAAPGQLGTMGRFMQRNDKVSFIFWTFKFMSVSSHDPYLNHPPSRKIYDDLDKDENGKLRFITTQGTDVWGNLNDL